MNKKELIESPPITKHHLGETLEEATIPDLAREIVELQKTVGAGSVIAREQEFMKDLLRRGLVFFVKDVAGKVIASFYLQPLDDGESSYRLGGMVALKGAKLSAMIGSELERFKKKTIIAFTSEKIGKAVFARSGFKIFTEEEFQNQHQDYYALYQDSSKTHTKGHNQRYCIRIAT